MRNGWIWLILLIFIVFLAGCVNQSATSGFKNDVITIEDYRIPKTIYSGSSNSIEFYIKNNGDGPVGNVEVNFFDVPSCFPVVSLTCNNERVDGDKCVFGSIDSGDARSVSLKLKSESVEYKTPCPISFSIKYDLMGSRNLNMIIIDRSVKDKPSGTGGPAPVGYGPIRLDIQPSVEMGETSNGYWVGVDEPFELDFKFTDVGTVLNAEEVNLSLGNVSLSYSSNLEIPNDLPCDFKDSLSTKSIKIIGDEKHDVLICNFQAKQIVQSEELGWVEANYSYTYKYIKTETFDINPR